MNNIKLDEMLQAFDEIQMPRTPFVLKNMVVDSKYTDEQRYAQCVLELSIAYDNLRMAELNVKKKTIEINRLDENDEMDALDIQVKQIEIEQMQRAMLGAIREFEFLYNYWQSFPIKFNRQELNNAQETEYTLRLQTQAKQDMFATGRISQGNQEGLRQLGFEVYPELDIARDVERRYLESGKVRILVAVPTIEKAENGLVCLEGLEFPTGAEIKLFNCWGRSVDDAYNHIVETALADKADYIVTIEDDTFPQKDAIVKLFELLKENPKSAVGAYYVKKEKSKQGVHIILKNGKRTQLKADGNVHEVYTLAMGCSIYPIEIFMKIPYPWFKTTSNLTQDSFFSQLARENGYKLLVDTSIKCIHKDRITGEEYTC